MVDRRPHPVVVDTGAFFAHYYERAGRHDDARATFAAIRDGDLPYRPLYTSRHVLVELAVLLDRKADHATAVRALREIRGASDVHVLVPEDAVFDAACGQFARYDDQSISLVDHLCAAIADARDTDLVFTFDTGDFRTLGCTCVPDDTGTGH